MIPVSTARSNPAWFGYRGKPWLDKRGVVNGLRVEQFAPAPGLGVECSKYCSKKGEGECGFLAGYARQLDAIDCEDLLARLERLCESMRVVAKFEGEPTVVFIVHEAPSNPCSERAVIQEYFRKNGVQCEEVDLNAFR